MTFISDLNIICIVLCTKSANLEYLETVHNGTTVTINNTYGLPTKQSGIIETEKNRIQN